MSNPDYHSQEITASEVKDALDSFGCCVLRSILPEQIIHDIQAVAQKQYAQMEQRFAEGSMSDEEYRHCYQYGIVRPFEDALVTQSNQLVSALMLSIVQKGLLKSILQAHFGSDVHLLIPSSHMRKVKAGRGVPFHQDSSVMRLHTTRVLNCWFPLDKAGEESPTMEVFPTAVQRILPTGDRCATKIYSHLEIIASALDEMVSVVDAWSPTLYPGDVLLLDSYTIHRTHQTSRMTEARTDFELRFAAQQTIAHRDDIAQQKVEWYDGR